MVVMDPKGTGEQASLSGLSGQDAVQVEEAPRPWGCRSGRGARYAALVAAGPAALAASAAARGYDAARGVEGRQAV